MAAVATALLVGVAPASGHEELPLHALTVLDRISPAVDGLEVRVVHLGAPALAVRNTTGRDLTVLGLDAEPFLRIGPSGVEANVLSPTTYRSIDPAGDEVPGHVDARARPRWVRLSAGSTWTWFDPRLMYSGSPSRWAVVMQLGSREVVAEGAFEPLEGHGHFITSLNVPIVRGLELRVIDGPVPAIFVRNDTGETFEVDGMAGEPFLRIGPRGVSANLRSPSYYTAGAQTIRAVPAFADASAPPLWKKLSTQPMWAWLEYRAAVPPDRQQRGELGAERRPVLEWASPVRLGHRRLPLTGRVEWVPPMPTHALEHSANSLATWVAVSALVLGLGLAAFHVYYGRVRAGVA